MIAHDGPERRRGADHGTTRSRRVSRLTTAVAVVLLDWAALGLTIGLVPGISAVDRLGRAARRRRARSARRGAAPGAGRAAGRGSAGPASFVGWLLTQALLVYLALSVTPGLQVDGFWPAFWASWLYARAGQRRPVVRHRRRQPGVVTRHLLRVNRRYRPSRARDATCRASS